MSRLVQPALQRVRTEILLDDEDGPPRGRESFEPSQQHGVQFVLAHFDGRIAPDQIEVQ
ncbi:MAG: hypothetical protein RLZ86_459 [Actinomycetota bacterium]